VNERGSERGLDLAPRKDFAFISHKLGRNFSPHLALNAEKWHVRWERDFLGGH